MNKATKFLEGFTSFNEEYDWDDLTGDLMKIVKDEIDMEPKNTEYLDKLKAAYDFLKKSPQISESKLKSYLSFINDTTPREKIAKAIRRFSEA